MSEQRFAAAVVLPMAAVLFAVQLGAAFGSTYGYFLDEFYYLACAKRLAWGYVDHPPLAPLVLRMSTALLGDSLPALRLLPALAGGAAVALTGWMAYRMGGGRLAQGIAALSLLAAPLTWVLSGFFSMNVFEILFWSSACWILVELCRSGDERLWVALGAVLGVAVLNKHTAAMLALAVAVATLLTPLRGSLARPWLWLGAVLAVLVVLPNGIWQHTNGWPSLEFYSNLDRESNIPLGPLEVLAEQIGTQNPGTFPVWLAGAIFLFSARGRRYRALGFMFVTLLAIAMLLGKSRADRIMGVYPVMFAAGGVALEQLCARPRLDWVRFAVPGLLVATAGLMLPVLLPLSPSLLEAYPLSAETNDARREVGVSSIPLWFSHRLGSEEFVETVAGVFRALPTDQQHTAVILAGDFAHAGAIEHFGPQHGLPAVYSPHNHYYFWPPPAELRPPLVIAIALDERVLRREFASIEEVARYDCAYCMGWRDDLPIYLARAPRRPLLEFWPDMKRFGLPTRKVLMLEETPR